MMTHSILFLSKKFQCEDGAYFIINLLMSFLKYEIKDFESMSSLNYKDFKWMSYFEYKDFESMLSLK